MVEKVEKRDTRRRFEQWAHNPNCEANTISAVHGIAMADVAKAEGLKPSMGQSPFAIARGQGFERGLFKLDAKELRAALETGGVLPQGSRGFLDLRMKNIGGPMRDLDEARLHTLDFLKNIGTRQLKARPTVIASPTLLIPAGVMLPEALLVIDVAVVHYDKDNAVITVGEIKTYADRGGHTDPAELALARAQAGVYVHALRMVIEEIAASDKIAVSDRGFLVLSRPGYNKPSIRANEDLRYQAMRAKHGFEMLEAAAEKLQFPDIEIEEKRIAAVREAKTDYNERCVSFCDRVQGCRAKAMECGSPAILGEDVVRLLGGLTLNRAEELVKGSPAATPLEERVLVQLRVNR